MVSNNTSRDLFFTDIIRRIGCYSGIMGEGNYIRYITIDSISRLSSISLVVNSINYPLYLPFSLDTDVSFKVITIMLLLRLHPLRQIRRQWRVSLRLFPFHGHQQHLSKG